MDGASSFLQVALPIGTSILIATGGWIFTYLHGRRAVSREAELERVNNQVRLLYGPLYASLLANNSSWDAFCENHWPAHGKDSYFGDGYALTEEERERWVTWVREVFHPNNERIEALILDHLDLVEGGKMPKAFVVALAHIATYRAVISQWKAGDFSEYDAVVNFPAGRLLAAVKPTYFALLRKQHRLITGNEPPPSLIRQDKLTRSRRRRRASPAPTNTN